MNVCERSEDYGAVFSLVLSEVYSRQEICLANALPGYLERDAAIIFHPNTHCQDVDF